MLLDFTVSASYVCVCSLYLASEYNNLIKTANENNNKNSKTIIKYGSSPS